jgi:DNA polymerase-3 subunit gamma/tau
VVLARKWRPGQFSDIVGQGHIVRTLMNAIRSERIHQAYLLTGSRGIGKTSIARIFAKAVRCPNAKWADGVLRSCDECSSCQEITRGTSVDVIEIDGASNNGVDAVREIRENAKYLPASGNRKIYIIDEVHMLTTAAFNALLKTLEEPPPHVIFIFATTEPHKIPATILSRCQRFDLRRVTVAQVQARLAEITAAEKIAAEPGALALIARAAEGSMRDGLSLLDQVIAYSGDKLTAQSVRESIGLIEGQTMLGILRGVAERKPLPALELVEQAYQQGHDLRVLTRGLVEFLHGAILAKLGAKAPASLELSDNEWSEIQEIAQLRPLEELELIFQVIHHGIDWIARSPQPKIVLDVLLAKCATAEILAHANAAPTTGGPSGPSPVVAKPAAAKPAVATVASAPTGPLSWEGFVAHVRKTRPLLASILENGHCESAQSSELEVFYRPEDAYFRQQLQSKAYADQLLALTREYFGKPTKLKVELKEAVESMASRRESDLRAREAAARDAVKNHPIITEARALFGGELGAIELNGGTPHAANPSA